MSLKATSYWRREIQGSFNFDGLESADYGVFLKGGGTFNAPRRKYTVVDIPGRNGGLTLDDGAYEDVTHTYPAFIARGFENNVQEFRNLLASKIGMLKLTDSFHPDEYYKARYMAGLEVDVTGRAASGSFQLEFMRDPRRFLWEGQFPQKITPRGYLRNPTNQTARPLIHISGSGTLTLNDFSITVDSGLDEVWIDSEMMECYKGLQSVNLLVVFSGNDFPTLAPGITSVACGDGIGYVEITPNWWRL